jgi:hypothetical protein
MAIAQITTSPAALLAVIVVCCILLACTAARLASRPADDNGLKYEGTYTSRTRKHNGRQ